MQLESNRIKKEDINGCVLEVNLVKEEEDVNKEALTQDLNRVEGKWSGYYRLLPKELVL